MYLVFHLVAIINEPPCTIQCEKKAINTLKKCKTLNTTYLFTVGYIQIRLIPAYYIGIYKYTKIKVAPTCFG